MSPEENKRLVARFYEEIDKGNIDAMDELIDEKYIDLIRLHFPDCRRGAMAETSL